MRCKPYGLTLLELLLSMALLSIVMIIIAAAIGTMQNTWMRLREKSDEYRGARMALDSMTRHLQQATLATRWVWDPDSTIVGKSYKRATDLHFISGPSKDILDGGRYSGDVVFFQGPFGEPENDLRLVSTQAQDKEDLLTDTMCGWGYFVEFGTDAGERPTFLRQERDRVPPRRRFRLMEFRQPAKELELFKPGSLAAANEAPIAPINDPQVSTATMRDWFRKPLQTGNVRTRHAAVLAENVIACVITPMDPGKLNETEKYLARGDGIYDSREGQNEKPPTPETLKRLHKLPPALRLTVVITSEDSWKHLTEGEVDNTAMQLRTTVNGLFKSPKDLETDLGVLERKMDGIKMRYRIFTTHIRMAEQ